MVILACVCANKFQDSRYGRGMRVFNQTQKDEGQRYRCATCLQEILVAKEKRQ